MITANPKTAGVARWNFLALWGHKQDKGEEESLEYCKKVGITVSRPVLALAVTYAGRPVTTVVCQPQM